MLNRIIFRSTARQRIATTLFGLAIAGGFAGPAGAATPDGAAVPGITVEATLKPVRLLDIIPTRTVRFELTITVARTMSAFAGIHYECLFVDDAGAPLGIASRGIASRDAFTAAADGRLVSVAHEELADIGPVAMRCRATQLEK